PMEQRSLCRDAKVGAGVIRTLIEKGLARKHLERVERLGLTDDAEVKPAAPITLNADQEQVWKPVGDAVEKGGYHAFLLHGVTGSGKTEIYLRAIEEVIRQGKEALVLVPEISLTPQTIERFRGRCGNVAVMHSHLSDSERAAHWRRIAAGQVQVVVGARSAVFAPCRNLGLMV